jgi:penicillin amidase
MAAPAAAQDAAPPQELEAGTALPPGNNGFYSVEGQARGQAAQGEPSAYGPHIDDQREMYWNFEYKPGGFHAQGTPVEPKPGVRIYRDDFGVPSIYAEEGRDVWFGAGYAAAVDRLFLMDGVRRTGLGTLAELTGASTVPEDVRTRVLSYTAEEYEAFFETLPQEGKDAVDGYVDGVNARLDEVEADPTLLPAEYVLLTSTPRRWERNDILAGGVYITRYVAAEGGKEMANVAALRELEEHLGEALGRGVFQDLVWQDDPKAVVTVPDRSFENQPGTPAQRQARFEAMAEYAGTIPLELADGDGTGAHPVPSPLPASTSSAPEKPEAPRGPDAGKAAAKAAKAVHDHLSSLRGGSLAVAVAPKSTTDGRALLLSGPQLGYTYPSLLWELEVHGGGYDARGVSVPGLPTVGIGYGERVAWALTSGYSKTIDSYIETTRANPDGTGPMQYLHDGAWKDMDCRDESVAYRLDPEGVPTGPAVFSEDVEVCRTVHGPVVAVSDDGTKARSVQYAMWGRELESVTGILAWNRADSFEEFEAGVAQVTWNENVLYADADGRIAYWHPGLTLRRDPEVDQRLPAPGTGEYDPSGVLSFEEMPHSVDPDQGWLANWNNKPARGWLDGEGYGDTSRPGGPVQRVRLLVEQLAGRTDLDYAGIKAVDRIAGTTDVRRLLFHPLLAELAERTDLSQDERDAVTMLLAWDGTHLGEGADTQGDPETDGPAPTLFDELVLAVRRELFATLLPDDGSDAILDRQAAVGSHVYDTPPLDNLAARVLRTDFSGLAPSRDYTGGRTPVAVIRAALNTAISAAEAEHGTDFREARRLHPRSEMCSLTGGVIGPCATMPYQDRGSWIHVVALNAPRRPPPPAGPPDPADPPLPATGLETALLAYAALVVAVGVTAVRRRRRT